jgi:hypothetical protein
MDGGYFHWNFFSFTVSKSVIKFWKPCSGNTVTIFISFMPATSIQNEQSSAVTTHSHVTAFMYNLSCTAEDMIMLSLFTSAGKVEDWKQKELKTGLYQILVIKINNFYKTYSSISNTTVFNNLLKLHLVCVLCSGYNLWCFFIADTYRVMPPRNLFYIIMQ